MFKVCIISCGMITNAAHIPAYRQFPEDYDIVAVCDINEQYAKQTAEKHGIPHYYTKAEVMLEKHKPDIVSVCVPNCFHKEYTLMALQYGANVLCEKPVAMHYNDALEMYDCAKRHGKLLMACQSMRFTPDRLAAKKFIENGGMDNIYYGEFSRIRRRGIPTWGTFHLRRVNCGGAFIDIGVHMLDALIWLMDNPKAIEVEGNVMKNHSDEIGSLVGSGALTGEVNVQGKYNPDDMDVEDFACGTILFDNSATVSFKVAWATNIPEAADIRLVSKKAGLDIPTCNIYTGETGVDSLPVEESLYDGPFTGHKYIMENLRNVLKGEAEPIIKPEETLNVTKIIDMFYKNANLDKLKNKN